MEVSIVIIEMTSPPGLIDVIECMCSQGYLRQVTALCMASNKLAAAAPLGTAKQIYKASRAGHDTKLSIFLAFWNGNDESWNVLNWV